MARKRRKENLMWIPTPKLNHGLLVMVLIGSLSALLAVPNSVLAIAIDLNLNITGTVELDPSTLPADGLGSQNATYFATSGGTASSNAGGFVNIGFTELGDGVGILTNASGSGAFASSLFFGNDYTINLVNNALSDTFKVTFQIDYMQSASVTEVAAAKATLDVDRQLPGPAVNELFSFGDLDTTLGNFGPFADFGNPTFDITLAPGEVGLVEGKQDIEGVAIGGSYDVTQDMFISVVNVMNTTPSPPQSVPEPGTFLLLGTGLAGLFAFRKKSRNNG